MTTACRILLISTSSKATAAPLERDETKPAAGATLIAERFASGEDTRIWQGEHELDPYHLSGLHHLAANGKNTSKSTNSTTGTTSAFGGILCAEGGAPPVAGFSKKDVAVVQSQKILLAASATHVERSISGIWSE